MQKDSVVATLPARARAPEGKLFVKLKVAADMYDMSVSTFRRRMKDDPDFPQATRFSRNGDLVVSVADLHACATAKAARRRAA